MKHFFYILLFTCPILIFSQKEKVILDSIAKKEKEIYIEDHTNQFNVKLEFSNDIQEFKIPFNNQKAIIEPNLGYRYGVVLSYKFASVRIGIRPSVSNSSKEEKGDPNSFRIKFILLFDKWSHKYEYNRVEGYYITSNINGFETIETNNYVQFPDLVTNVFSGSSAYKLNPNYSIRATMSQTEVQLKSAGSFMPGINYLFYDFKGLDTYINKDGEEVTRTDYIKSSGFDAVLNLGYYYTFVYKKWYANAFALPGIGMDFNKTTSYTPEGNSAQKYQNLILSISGGAGIGFNGEKVFFGASLSKRYTDEKYKDNKVQLNTSKNSFFVFLGYRFKAPKQIAKPIDNLEEKIPLLKKD